MNQDEIRRQELSDFLRTRRARLAPTDVGMPLAKRRRTPGLRREEVAQSAGISVTWYTWLEQKRPINVSAAALDNLARVLRLDPIERAQLFQLALRQPTLDTSSQREKLSPRFQRMIDHNPDMPVFVIGRRWDILAWNQAACAFFIDFEQIPVAERNLVWLFFTSPALRAMIVDWPMRTRDMLARFRVDYGRHVGDSYFVDLVDRLNTASPEFAQWWPRHDIRPTIERSLPYDHPLVGHMLVDTMILSVVDNPAMRLFCMLPAAEADSINKMRKIIAAFHKGKRPKRTR